MDFDEIAGGFDMILLFYGNLLNCDGPLAILKKLNGILVQLYGFLWNVGAFWCNFMDFDGILRDSDGTLWILMEFYGISMILHGFLWNIGEF
jgi:hypothetical protein